jgi:hypothetical protein
MANSLSSLTAGVGGVQISSVDTSGSLDIKSGTTTIVSITSAGAAVTGNLTASSLTSGRVTFASTAGLLADSSSFTYNGSQLNLTGTAYGGLNLQSRTDAAQVSASLFFTTSTSGNYLMRGDTGSLAFLSGAIIGSNGGTERMRLDSSGNLGLGVTPSAWFTSNGTRALQIGNRASLFSFSSTTTDLANNVYQSAAGDYAYLQTAAASFYRQSTGSHQWYTAPSGTAGNAITFTQAMTLDASGNLLVGATSAILGGQLTIAQRSGSTSPITCDLYYASTKAIKFGWYGGEIGSISVNAGGTAIAYNTSSDYRLKNTIEPMVGALAKVAALKPCTYKWNADGSDGEGFIAHELAEVIPNSVAGEKDATEEQEYEISPAIPAVLDEEGNVVTEEVPAVMGTRTVPVYQGIDTSFLVATLTAAIQEQQAMIDELRAEIDLLKGVK